MRDIPNKKSYITNKIRIGYIINNPILFINEILLFTFKISIYNIFVFFKILLEELIKHKNNNIKPINSSKSLTYKFKQTCFY